MTPFFFVTLALLGVGFGGSWGSLGFPQEIVFRNGVKNIQAVAYNGARTVYIYINMQ